MSDYIREIKRQFRDVHGFVPSRVVGGEPCFDTLPDGEYPMTIEGKVDRVLVKDGKISCCRSDPEGDGGQAIPAPADPSGDP